MASPVDPRFVMGVRLDGTGRKAHQRILAAFKKLDPASVAVAVATGEAETAEEDPTGSVWDRILSALVDEFLDAHLDAMDAALEYLNRLVTSPVAVDPGPFLGQAGTQTVESFVGSTPTVVGQKVAGGMDAAQALNESRDLLAASARADSYALGRDVVATVANNDPRFTHYARKAEPGACSWCQMLETRGAVYTVDTATKTRDGQPYHKPYLMTKKDGGTALVGGYCQCDMVAEPADGHASTTEYRPGRPGDKAAVRSAYKVGAKTTERAGTVNRQLEVLRAQKAAGKATDWTLAKITALEAEQTGLLGAAMAGEFRSAPVLALGVVTRHMAGKHNQKTHGKNFGDTVHPVTGRRPTTGYQVGQPTGSMIIPKDEYFTDNGKVRQSAGGRTSTLGILTMTEDEKKDWIGALFARSDGGRGLRVADPEVQQALEEFHARHLPGKHNQKTHGHGGGGSPELDAAEAAGQRTMHPITSAAQLDARQQASLAEAFDPYTRRRKDGSTVEIHIDRDELKAHIADTIRGATPQQREEGMRWYADAHDFGMDLAKKYDVEPEVAFKVVAALSPKASWASNKTKAEKALRLYKEHGAEFADLSDMDLAKKFRLGFASGPNSDAVQAVRIMRGEQGLPTGLKRQSFVNNMHHPENAFDVTVDGWVAGALQRSSHGLNERDALDWVARGTNQAATTGLVVESKGYIAVADVVREVGAELDMTPQQAQAVYWVAAGGGSGAAMWED